MIRRARVHRGILLVAATALGCFARTRAEDPLPRALQDAAVVADPETEARRVVASAYLPVPPWEAWDWVASADRLESWLAFDVTLDPFVGAPVTLVSPEHARSGEVTAVDEPRSMTWTFADGATQRSIEWTVTADVGGARVGVSEGPFDASAEGEALAVTHRRRWTEVLRVLRAAVERKLPTVPQELPGTPPPPR